MSKNERSLAYETTLYMLCIIALSVLIYFLAVNLSGMFSWLVLPLGILGICNGIWMFEKHGALDGLE